MMMKKKKYFLYFKVVYIYRSIVNNKVPYHTAGHFTSLQSRAEQSRAEQTRLLYC